MSQGWSIDATADTITFFEPPPAGTNNIVVTEYATAAINATAIWKIGAWNGEYGFPKEVEFFGDRACFAATRAQPQTLWLSRTGDYSMFGKSTPIADDDAITATLNARQLNEIIDLLPKQHLLALSIGNVWKIGGGEDDPLTPSSIAARPQPSRGAGDLPALDVGETAVYYTYKGGQVRDLSFAFEADGYAGSDLSAFASHLLDRRTLVDWAWQDVPYSAVYAVRDDGWLLTLTYKREHQVVAWARHETLGDFESIVTVPEPGGQAVYAVVRREIGGQVVRYVERFADLPGDDWREHVGVDCALTYDGRNQPGTLTLSGGSSADDLVTVACTSPAFALGNVGDAVVIGFDDIDAQPYTVTITEFSTAHIVRGIGNMPRPYASANAWALAVDTLSGLAHLEGREVQVASDGYDGGRQVVAGGKVRLDRPGVLVHVGLPFAADFESLDLMLIGQESITTRAKNVRSVGVLARDCRVLHVGPDFDHMEPRQPRDHGPMGVPPSRMDGWEDFPVSGSWDKDARVCIRCTDPYGGTVLAIEPEIEVGR